MWHNFIKLNKSIILLMLFFFISVLLGGLFQETYLYFSLIVITLIFLFFNNKNEYYVDKRMLLLFGAFTFCAILSIYFSINLYESIHGLLKELLSLIVFSIGLNVFVKHSEHSSKNFNSYLGILWCIFIASMLCSIINIIKAYSSNYSYRFEEIIQYSNTLALFLFISSIIGFTIYITLKQQMHQNKLSLFLPILLKLGIFLDLSSFILTYSRFMWITGLIIFFLYIIFLKDFFMVINILLICVLSVLFCSFVAILGYNYILILTMLFLIIISSFELLLHKLFFNHIQELSNVKSVFLKTISITILSVVGLAAIFIRTKGDEQLGFLYERITTINLNSTEFLERLAYYVDAIKIIKDHPLLGTGHGGWASIQYKYQTAQYAVKFVHSSIIQIALDYGIIALLLFTTMIIIFFVYSIKSIKKAWNSPEYPLILSAIIINSEILFHSLLDIDFEFPIIMCIFWLNTGFLSSYVNLPCKVILKVSKKILTTNAVMLLILIVPLFISTLFYDIGYKHFDNKSYLNAMKNFETSLKFNPFYSEAGYMYINTLKEVYSVSQNNYMINDVLKKLNFAEKFDRYNPRYPAKIAYLLKLSGNYEQSIIEYEKLINAQPIIIDYYEVLAETLVEKGQRDMESGLTNEAFETFNKCIMLEAKIESMSKSINPLAIRLKHKPNLTVTPSLAFSIGKSNFYLGQAKKAETYFEIACNDPSYKKLVEDFMLYENVP